MNQNKQTNKQTGLKLTLCKLVSVAILALFGASVWGQTQTITGKVIDQTGEPVLGAYIVVKNTAKTTTTGNDGVYSVSGIKPTDILEFKFIGMKTEEITVGDKKVINVTLKDDVVGIDQVVVTALGITKQAKSVGYSTTKVAADELERINVINPVNALQGKVAGLNINIGGASGVTSSSSITIRGAKSMSKNNSPIWVVDGMILQEPITGNIAGTDWGSQLKNLNPADYESITVLKGAAATALYGSRGANGAIVIVSKGGKFGKKGLGVEISQIAEFTQIYKSPIDLQNIYGAGHAVNGTQGGFLSDGSLQKTRFSWGPKMDGRLIDQYMPGLGKTPFVPHPNNWKSLYKTGFNTTTNVAISGGNEKTSFRLSYSYTDNNGVFKRNNFKRNNIMFRFLSELNDVFSVEAGVNYAFSKALNGANQGGWNWGNNLVMLSTYYNARNVDIATYQKNYRDPVTHAVETDSPYGTLRGYLHSRDMNTAERKENSMLANIKINAKVAPWLTASLKGNYNYYETANLKKEYGMGAYYGPTGSGYYAREGNNSGGYNILGMLQSSNNEIKFGSETITLDAIVAAELYGNLASNWYKKETKGGLITPGVFAFSNSSQKIEPEYNYTPRNNQTFGISAILNLGWRDQLFLELTARNDWLSTLTYPKYMLSGENNYSVFYPSANLSWVFTESLKMPEWLPLSMGKFRASIAKVGMGTEPYKTTEGFGVYKQSSIYDSDRKSVISAVPNLGTAWIDDLKAEMQQSIELGADLRFFNERLNFDIAWYKTNTRNQIMKLNSVVESGASNMIINAGNIQNKGIEISVDATPIRTHDFRWTIGGTYTLNRGTVKKLHQFAKEWQLMDGYDAGPEIWAFEGSKLGVLTSVAGRNEGSPVYHWDNKDDKNDPRNGKMVMKFSEVWGATNPVNAYEVVNCYSMGIRDRIVLGKIEANYLFSINTSLSYKDFDFYAQIDGRVGGKYFSNAYKYASSVGNLKSSLKYRDKEHGGLARTNYEGKTVYDGMVLDAVFAAGTKAPSKVDPTKMIDVGGMLYMDAVNKGLIEPVMTSTWYMYNYGWGMPNEWGLQDNTWASLREITIGYRLPEKICKKIGLNYLRVGITARNICYIVNKLTDGMNPASISSNDPLRPMDIGGTPFARTYAINLTLRF